MDFYILPFLGSFEFNPWGSCTLDPRALLLVHYSTLEHKSCIWKKKGGKLGDEARGRASKEGEGSSENGR